jgi:hypothetical protein
MALNCRGTSLPVGSVYSALVVHGTFCVRNMWVRFIASLPALMHPETGSKYTRPVTAVD